MSAAHTTHVHTVTRVHRFAVYQLRRVANLQWQLFFESTVAEQPDSPTACAPVHFSCCRILCWVEQLWMPKAVPYGNSRLQNVA
jgi:hypothetical protein